MSSKYPGGVISKTAPTPSGPYSTDTAPGVWTLEQQAYWQKLGQWPTAGNVNPNAFIENLFSTYLYTGTGVARTITNGIDLSGNGGAVWIKGRNQPEPHVLVDTARGASNALRPNASDASINDAGRVSAFTTSGFTVGTDGETNGSGTTYASWTFREQAKFFDIVTWSGDSTSGRQIAHNLGSTPGMVIIKSLVVDNWCVWHRSLTAGNYIVLNSTAAQTTSGAVNRYGNGTTTVDPTSTYITVGSNGEVNQTGNNYVAYLFAHDAGGFGLTGTDNVISCGSFTTDGSGNATVSLGYEPQYILMKKTSGVQNWVCYDTMRGWAQAQQAQLYPNITQAEDMYTGSPYFFPTATGFSLSGTFGLGNNDTFIYIAIRRGPMKVPTSGTSVFDVGTRAGSASVAKTNSNILTDLAVIKRFTSGAEYWAWTPRLVGNLTLQSNSTDAELQGAMATNPWDTMTGAFCAASNGATNTSTLVDYSFRRAPGFFDEVCYTGTGSATTVTHNLGVVPELMIVKVRNDAQVWQVYSAATGNAARLQLNTNDSAFTASAIWNTTTPTSSVFSVGTNVSVNGSGSTYVAYLFATCAGVSKVGSYTGTGAAQTINCGFTSGARFVLIKRTDSTGDWYFWDSARGIIPSNDPYLLLNSTAAEVTGTDYVDTTSVGFDITSTAPSAINANGGTFIFLAIA